MILLKPLLLSALLLCTVHSVKAQFSSDRERRASIRDLQAIRKFSSKENILYFIIFGIHARHGFVFYREAKKLTGYRIDFQGRNVHMDRLNARALSSIQGVVDSIGGFDALPFSGFDTSCNMGVSEPVYYYYGVKTKGKMRSNHHIYIGCNSAAANKDLPQLKLFVRLVHLLN